MIQLVSGSGSVYNGVDQTICRNVKNGKNATM